MLFPILNKNKRSFQLALTVTLMILLSFNLSVAYAEKITLKFRGADINAVITSVADITGKNFIVDPRVKGKVTIISSRAMNASEIYQVFLSVLDVHGYTAVPAGKTIKILPDADAKHSAIPAPLDGKTGKGDESITRVIEVEHVAAAQLVPILRPLVPPQGHLAAYPQSNMLIISDRAANIERLLSIITRIDQPTSGEIEIVRLEYAAASDLVRVLSTLQQSGKPKGAAKKPTLVADERTNSILIGGDRSDRLQLRAIISHLDTPSEVVGDTHVIYLRYANAADLVPVLTGVGDSTKVIAANGAKGAAKGARRGAQSSRSPLLNIQADESSNALVITAPPALFRSLEAVIRQLDIRRAQVLVEAVIAEVSSEKEARLGIEWLVDGSGGNNPVGAVDFTGVVGAASAAAAGTVGALGSLFDSGATLAFGRFDSDTLNFAGLIKALEGDGSTNVLSTPSLVTLDNEEAEIFIGQQVSIPSGSFSSTGTGGSTPNNPFTTFDRVPVGISLKVKPQISEGDTVRLDIDQSVDSIAAGSAGQGDIITSERKINTSVMVDNGKVLVLGGLIKDDLVENEQKVPLLGDIPLLGALFRFKSVKKVKTNLLVFLRPVILRDEKDGMALTNSKYKYIRDLQLEQSENGVSLLSSETTPLLPELEGFLELPPPYVEARKENQTQLQYELQRERAEEFVVPGIE
ncbi:MAG: type II secretion system secretin GspD [Gammaproteobacteria bacterium]|nr:type II secretion system secretin GspD [Gammaproteobacteria bacterium]